MIKVPIKIENGRILLRNEYDKEQLKKFVDSGRSLGELVLREHVSSNARGYWFGAVIPFIHKLGMYPGLAKMELTPELREVYHEVLKKEFNGIDYEVSPGQWITVGKSICSVDKDYYSASFMRLNEYVLENFGMNIPSPDEYRQYFPNNGKEFHDWYIENKGIGSQFDGKKPEDITSF